MSSFVSDYLQQPRRSIYFLLKKNLHKFFNKFLKNNKILDYFPPATMSDDSTISQEICNNKNKQNVRCRFCNSLILKDQQGLYENSQFDLPLMHQKNSTKDVVQSIESDSLNDFWVVDDMFTFENIGFSNTVDKRKFLICADCDMGPVGYHNLDTKKCYIALKRVKHGNEPVLSLTSET